MMNIVIICCRWLKKVLNCLTQCRRTKEHQKKDMEMRVGFILIILSIINYIHTDMFIFVLYLQNNVDGDIKTVLEALKV